MFRSLRVLAALLALATFTAACGGDDDDASAADETTTDIGASGDAADSDDTSDDTDGDDATTGEVTDDADEPVVDKTQDEIVAASDLALPDDFVIATATQLDGEILVTGAYSGDPQGPVATMTAAGWTHLGTRDGSFIMDFRYGTDSSKCALVYALVSGSFATLTVFDAADCEAYSLENASRAKEAAESNGAAAN